MNEIKCPHDLNQFLLGGPILENDVIKKVRAIIAEWKADTWTDNLSYECMVKIAELIEEGDDRYHDRI